MVNYKEFEVLRTMMAMTRDGKSLSDACLSSIVYDNTHYRVFKDEADVKFQIASLESKGYLKGVEITPSAMTEIEPCRVENAIILAAGGSDISAKSVYSMPKGLFIKNGETLIERQIRQLREAGIQDITVVVGYKQEMYYFLEDKWNITLEINPDLKKNNIFSLYIAKSHIGSTYICNCDNYFEENPFSLYEYNAFHATVIKEDASNELLVRKNETGRILEVYSGAKSGECVFGHAYFDKKFSTRFCKYMEDEISDFRFNALFWEEFVNRHVDNLDMYVRRYSADFVFEFDSIQEIQNIDGLFLENVSGRINEKICKVFGCEESDISNVVILQKGLSNVLFTFDVKGETYIFRYPGESTSAFIYRTNEVEAQKVAAAAKVDNTYVYIDDTGLKISKFVKGCKNINPYYYHDLEMMKLLSSKIRDFHDEAKMHPELSKYVYNPIVEADQLMKNASHMKGNMFELFKEDRDNIVKLFEYTERDGIEKCMCHNDINGDNCLLTDTSFDVIDWEFAGYNDPAYDFGRVIGGYDFDSPDVDAILESYFHRPATEIERLHWIAYVGIHSWYYFNWALYKESINESSRDWMLFFYKKAKEVARYALPKYEEYYK